jgi:hypothetical protein
MRINHRTAHTPQRTLRWGLSWDGSGPMRGGPCGDEDCAGPWQRMGGATGMDRDFSAVRYLLRATITLRHVLHTHSV